MYISSNNFATPKQLNFIKSLAAERLLPANINLNPTRKLEASNVIKALLNAPKKTAALGARSYVRSRIGDFVEVGSERGELLTAGDVQCEIDEIRRMQDARKARSEQLVPGVYEVEGVVYVVKYNREKTNLYAKRMVEVGAGVTRATEAGSSVRAIEFEYAPGAVFNIRLADRMPVERAKELITLYGTCIACGRRLKAAKSVEAGIGPVCIKNFGPVLQQVEAVTVDGRDVVVAA